VSLLSRHRREVLDAWADRIRASAQGRRLVRDAGGAVFQRALSRVFLALERRPAKAPRGPAGANLSRLLTFLESHAIDPAWCARWCASLFDVCRARLEADEGIPRRDRTAAIRALDTDHGRVQAALLHSARVPARGRPGDPVPDPARVR